LILNFGLNSSIDTQAYERDGIRIFITGQSGSGKSYLAKVLLEEFADNRYPIVLIDPEGEYASFKEVYSTIIVGGEHGDLSFESLNVGLDKLIELVYNGDFQFLIFDTSQKMSSEQEKLHADILYDVFDIAGRKRYPLILLVEEAHLIAPERRGMSKTLELAIEIAKRGRKRGLHSIWVTQRPADISKKVISQCNIRFFGRLQDPTDINALRPYIRSAGVTEEQLMRLNKKFFLYANGQTKLVTARKLKTSDLGSTPSISKLELRDAAATSKQSIIDALTSPSETTTGSTGTLGFDEYIPNPRLQSTHENSYDFNIDSLNNPTDDALKLILSENLKKQLILRGKLHKLKQEKKFYLNELKSIEYELDSGSKSLLEIESKLKNYKKKIADLKKQEKLLNLNIRELPHEKLLSDQNKVNKQLEKLDKLLESGKITESTYHELRSEFQDKLVDINKKIELVKSEMQKLLVNLNKEIVEIEKELELLYARFEVGQLSKESYANSEKELKGKLNDYRMCIEALKKEQASL